MPRYVQDGSLDCGLTGYDWILENDAKVKEVAELVFSKVSKKPVRWVLAVPNDSPIKDVKDLQGKRIATEVVNLTRPLVGDTRRYGPRRIQLPGATEVKPPRLADAIVEVTETGSSCGPTICASSRAAAKHDAFHRQPDQAYADPWKRQKMDDLVLMLQGAMAAEGKVGLMLNVRTADLPAVLKILPALQRPDRVAACRTRHMWR